jgi:hypothetical protein
VAQGGAVVGEVEEVAGVPIAGDEGKRALLAHAADEHLGPCDRGWLVDRLLEAVMWPFEVPSWRSAETSAVEP